MERVTFKVWFLSTALIVSFLFAASIMYVVNVLECNNVTSCKVMYLGDISETEYENIIFGTSVTLGATGLNIYNYPDTLNLTTFAQTAFAGNYFLLERFLGNGNSVKSVYLFFIPESLSMALEPNTELMRNYFHNVFNRDEEKKELRLMPKYKAYQATAPFDFALYWSSAMRNIKRIRGVHRANSVSNGADLAAIEQREMPEVTVMQNKEVLDKFKTRVAVSYTRELFLPESKYYIHKLVDFCNKNGIKLTFILAPLPEFVYQKLMSTSFKNDVIKEMSGANFIDINNHHIFPDTAFKDRLHLNPEWSLYYEKLIVNIIQ